MTIRKTGDIKENLTTDADRKRFELSAKRDITDTLPPIKDPARRNSCEKNFELFCKTYLHRTFNKPFSKYHYEIIKYIEDVILYGGKKSIAAPRAFGKDSMLMAAVIWALLYAHKKYLCYVGPNEPFGVQRLDNIKWQLEDIQNTEIHEDFPEVCYIVYQCGGVAQRAKVFTYNKQPIDLLWSSDEIRFPTLKDKDKKPINKNGGATITVFGLKQGPRGLNVRNMRPDIIIINDIENTEMAYSPAIREKAENTIDQSLCGLGGVGEDMAAFMICTILNKGCLSDKYTGMEKPIWNGSRYKSLITNPTNMELWEQYAEIRRECLNNTDIIDPDLRWPDVFYLMHKEKMDAGAEVIWEENYISKQMSDGFSREFSALQSIFNKWIDLGDKFFYCELQNEPNDITRFLDDTITPQIVSSRLNGYSANTVPPNTKYLTQYIDVGASELHFVVLAVEECGTGYVIDYGRVAVEKDMEQTKDIQRVALEKNILNALRLRREEAESVGYFEENGTRHDIELTVVDSGWLPDIIYHFVKESGSRYRASKGFGQYSAYIEPMRASKYTKKGFHWYAKRHEDRHYVLYHIDTYYWKEFIHLRFLQEPTSMGSCTLYGTERKLHTIFSKHICAEKYDNIKNKWIQLSKQNHFFDCICGSYVAASMCGIKFITNPQFLKTELKEELKTTIKNVKNNKTNNKNNKHNKRNKNVSSNIVQIVPPTQTKNKTIREEPIRGKLGMPFGQGRMLRRSNNPW